MTLPTVFLAHLIAAHLSVPEPVRFEFAFAPPGFESHAIVDRKGKRLAAQVARDSNGWLVRYDYEWYMKYPNRRAFILAHEACHAAFNDGPSYWTVSDKDRKHLEDRADSCARQILREHRHCKGDR